MTGQARCFSSSTGSQYFMLSENVGFVWSISQDVVIKIIWCSRFDNRMGNGHDMKENVMFIL